MCWQNFVLFIEGQPIPCRCTCLPFFLCHVQTCHPFMACSYPCAPAIPHHPSSLSTCTRLTSPSAQLAFLCLCLIVKKLSLPACVHHIALPCLPVGLLFLLIHHWIAFLLVLACLVLTLYILPPWPQSFHLGFRTVTLPTSGKSVKKRWCRRAKCNKKKSRLELIRVVLKACEWVYFPNVLFKALHSLV